MSRAHTKVARPGGTRTAYDRWSAAAFIAVIHLAPMVAVILGTRTTDWVAFLTLYPIFAVSTGVVLHRFFAHRSFATSRFLQFLLGWVACVMFVDPVSFAGKHRLHHRFSDTDRDVHSPDAGFWFCWFGSLVDEGYSDDELVDAASDLMQFPELRWLHRNFFVPGIIVCAMLFAAGGFSLFAIGYCLNMAVVLNQSSALNYFCHRWGYRRYATRDHSRNNIVVAVLTFGEGWHNNHHRYPASARAGVTRWELDPLFGVIRLLAACRLIWDVRIASDGRRVVSQVRPSTPPSTPTPAVRASL